MSEKKKTVALVGWLLAIAVAAAAALYLTRMSNRDLMLQVCLDGEPLCLVTDRGVVDEAMLLLNEKTHQTSLSDFNSHEFSYRCVVSDGSRPLDRDACAALLYERFCQDCVRAYRLTAEGLEVATCATYSDAEQVVADLRAYLVEQLSASCENGETVELTTDFTIESVICRRDEVVSASDVYRMIVSGPNTVSDSEPSPDRVTAFGGQAYLNQSKNTASALLRSETVEEETGEPFYLTVLALNAAISYHTVEYETYSEILACDTVSYEADDLYVGQKEVVFEGENGLVENVYEVAYDVDDVEIDRKLISSTVLSEPKDRIERVGTKEYPSTDPTGSFIWPLNNWFNVTCYYGVSLSGRYSATSTHLGIDLAGPKLGAPVCAADGGEVVLAENHGSYGLLVILQHEDGVQTYYGHLSNILVKAGDRVYQGQQIGEIGRSGVATGIHLHFEVRIDGKTVNPIPYLPEIPY